MAGLARDVGMFSGGASGGFGVVTERAGFLSGVRDGMGSNQIECSRPVVAKLAESFGNDRGADQQKGADCGQENDGRTEQMDPIAKQTAQGHPPENWLNYCHG